MKIDENNDPKPVNESAETRKNEALLRDKENEIRKEGLKKGVLTTSLIGLLILVIAGMLVFSHFNREHNNLLNQMETQKISFTDKVTARDSALSEWMTTFDEIERNIAMIKEKEHTITLNSSSTELSKDKRQQVLEDMKYINTLLEQNKQKIASLNAQLKKSGGTMKVLESKISDLEGSIKQNENEISELKTSLVDKKFEVEQLNTQVTLMQDTISKKNEKINNQTYEMNKAFFAIGTYKELKAKGLLTKEGGFIGLGKTKSLAGNFPDSSFTQIDITITKSFPVNCKSAKFITEHPANSYQFIRDKDKKIESLEITDPVQFWKISKYAVVEITK
jgi:predicted  nucleic acid-binding Zn-ribbon protein